MAKHKQFDDLIYNVVFDCANTLIDKFGNMPREMQNIQVWKIVIATNIYLEEFEYA